MIRLAALVFGAGFGSSANTRSVRRSDASAAVPTAPERNERRFWRASASTRGCIVLPLFVRLQQVEQLDDSVSFGCIATPEVLLVVKRYHCWVLAHPPHEELLLGAIWILQEHSHNQRSTV